MNELYTSSDIIVGKDLVISYYPERLFNTKTYLYAENTNWVLDPTLQKNNYFNMTIGGDDDIVKIIPRQYFINRGTYLYVGKEYGYYIKTVAEKYQELVYNKDNLSGESKNNDIQVLVFDINTNLHADADLISVRGYPTIKIL